MKPDEVFGANVPAVPGDGDGPVFRAPWEAQAFALAVALNERGLFTWKEWADELGKVIAEDAGSTSAEDYYRLWLDALERLIVNKSVLGESEMSERRMAWEAAAAATPHGQPIVLGAEEHGKR